MTFYQICQLGFRCPYHRISDDGDEICIYPYIRITEREEDETFGFPEEMDCPLMDYDSPLETWRSGYDEQSGLMPCDRCRYYGCFGCMCPDREHCSACTRQDVPKLVKIDKKSA